MAYSKHSPKSRKYKKSESHSKDHKSHSPQPPIVEENALPPVEEPVIPKEKKNPQAFSFLNSLFGSGEKDDRGDRSNDPLINIFGHDIYIDDLLLVGLILLLMTDKMEDEILIIILAYLLLDIF